MQLQIWDILSKSHLQLLGLLCAWDVWGCFFFCFGFFFSFLLPCSLFCVESCILDIAWPSSLDYA